MFTIKFIFYDLPCTLSHPNFSFFRKHPVLKNNDPMKSDKWTTNIFVLKSNLFVKTQYKLYLTPHNPSLASPGQNDKQADLQKKIPFMIDWFKCKDVNTWQCQQNIQNYLAICFPSSSSLMRMIIELFHVQRFDLSLTNWYTSYAGAKDFDKKWCVEIQLWHEWLRCWYIIWWC